MLPIQNISPATVGSIVASALLFGYTVHGLPAEGQPNFADHTVPLISAVMLFTFIRKLHYAYFMPMLLEYGPDEEVKARKCAQQLLNFGFHTMSTMYLIVNLPQREWFVSDEALWKDYPDQDQNYGDIVAYLLQLGYHINCLMIHFSEPRREDHYVMLVHHSVTVFLLVNSFALNYIRMGLLVLLYHDSSDILGCMIKMTNYLGWKKATLIIYPNMCFVWFMMRLYYFPRFIMYTALGLHPPRPEQLFSVGCLTVLCGLHAYWFYLFMKMGYLALKTKGKQMKDLSEDKDDSATASSTTTH
jgi:hypothetical protein